MLPPALARKATGLLYGWHGNYPSWEAASRRSTGYDSDAILEKVTRATLAVRSGDAAYDRDAVAFDRPEYAWPVLAGLLWIAHRSGGRLDVVDIGGALGSLYFQHRRFLAPLRHVRWNVVEQPRFAEQGDRLFASPQLGFYSSLEACLATQPAETVLLSGVLQYIERPWDLLDRVAAAGFRYVLVDRTPLIEGPDRITVQRVHPSIYPASYPCWFFHRRKFEDWFAGRYELVGRFDALDRANIASRFEGFIYERR